MWFPFRSLTASHYVQVCFSALCCTVIVTSEAAYTAEPMAEPTAEPALNSWTQPAFNSSPDGIVQEFQDFVPPATDPSVPEWITQQSLDPLGPILADSRFSGLFDGQASQSSPTQYTPLPTVVPTVVDVSSVDRQNINAQSQQLQWYRQEVAQEEKQAQQQRHVAEALTEHAKSAQTQVKAAAQQVRIPWPSPVLCPPCVGTTCRGHLLPEHSLSSLTSLFSVCSPASSDGSQRAVG